MDESLRPPAGAKVKMDETRRPLAGIEEVSAYLGVPVTTMWAWRHRNKGPKASKVGRHLRYRWADVDKWLDEQAEKVGS